MTAAACSAIHTGANVSGPPASEDDLQQEKSDDDRRQPAVAIEPVKNDLDPISLYLSPVDRSCHVPDRRARWTGRLLRI